MPIHAYIHINKDLINQIHIGRIKGGTDPDDINTYVVVDGEYPIRMEDWHIDGIPFEHRYGDGAEICVMKAMEALYGKTN